LRGTFIKFHININSNSNDTWILINITFSVHQDSTSNSITVYVYLESISRRKPKRTSLDPLIILPLLAPNP
jgi:hypothetical protein